MPHHRKPNKPRAPRRAARRSAHLRDEHGAVTLTGAAVWFENCKPGPGWVELGGSSGPDGFTVVARRIWLGGISAQRGY